jgi:hypothetical protein
LDYLEAWDIHEVLPLGGTTRDGGSERVLDIRIGIRVCQKVKPTHLEIFE